MSGCPKCSLLEAANEEMKKELGELKKQLQTLEERVKQNSSNSHKPPSSDMGTKGYKKRNKSGLKRGGQPGHEGKARELVPEEEVSKIEDVKPTECEHCHAALDGKDPEPMRHQTIELPEIKPIVIEKRYHKLWCKNCGKHTATSPGSGLKASAFGPNVHAWVEMLSGAYRLSKRNVKKLLAEGFSIKASLGSIVGIEHRGSEAMKEPYEKAKEFVRKQEKVNLDETRLAQENGNGWLWVAATEKVAVFDHTTSRGGSVARGLLGNDYAGIVGSDRYVAYDYWPDSNRQLCWAHLIRDFRKIASREGLSRAIGEALLSCAEKLFHQWHRFKLGSLSQSTFRSYLSELRCDIRLKLQDGLESGHSKTQATCANLLQHEAAMYTFGRVDGIEPTNNLAEQLIRPAVLWRKGSYGVQSSAGSDFIERIFTAAQSLYLQNRNLFDWLSLSLTASISGNPPPSLLPDSS